MAWHFAQAGNWSKPEWNCGTCKERGLFKSRNCSRYFPNQTRRKNPTWCASVSVQTGKPGQRRTKSRTIPGSASLDCPVAAITPDSLGLLELVRINRAAKESGACMWGPDLRHWPAVIFDAVALIENQIAAEQAIRYELTDASHG